MPRFDHLSTSAPRSGVTYWLYDKDGELIIKVKEAQCFGELRWGQPNLSFVQYLSDLCVSVAAARHWIRFMRGILGRVVPWRAEIVRCGDAKRLGVLWTLERLDDSETTNLLVVTLARYTDEFHPLPAYLYANRRRFNTVAKQLRAFQQYHLDHDLGYLSRGGNLAFNWEEGYGESAEKPVSFAQFRRNLRERVDTVEGHFA
jgi:hypothetical protein